VLLTQPVYSCYQHTESRMHRITYIPYCTVSHQQLRLDSVVSIFCLILILASVFVDHALLYTCWYLVHRRALQWLPSASNGLSTATSTSNEDTASSSSTSSSSSSSSSATTMLLLEAASVHYHYGAVVGRYCATDSSNDDDHVGSQQHTTVSAHCNVCIFDTYTVRYQMNLYMLCCPFLF
jgi:hypothetical protein